MTGEDPGQKLVDHKDVDASKNHWTNLRLADHSQNRVNSAGHQKRSSPFKGVSWHRCGWQVHICFRGKKQYLGISPTPEDGRDAYMKAAAELHGEFARG